jgi:membrane protease YdiL (CAAX protease family)
MSTAPVNGGTPKVARWTVRFRWLLAIAFALIPVILTAAGSAASQIAGTDEATSALIIAAGAGLGAAIGWVIMWKSPPSIREYGFQAPIGVRSVWWFLPLPVTVLIVLATQGVHVPPSVIAAYGVLTVAVALNEEIWFRGIVLAVLQSKGARGAIIGSSILFGVLHLANVFGGESTGAAVLQLVFALLFGFVAAELVVLTGTLWPVIAWHAAWDFTNYIGGNSTTGAAMTGVGIAIAVLLVYAVVLWRRGSARGWSLQPKMKAELS